MPQRGGSMWLCGCLPGRRMYVRTCLSGEQPALLAGLRAQLRPLLPTDTHAVLRHI